MKSIVLMARLLVLLSSAVFVPSSLSAGETVNVFILAGQSNMEGHGKVDAEPKANEGKGSLEWLVRIDETAPRF